MRCRISNIAFVVASIAAVFLQVAIAGAQTAQHPNRNRVERLRPIVEWLEQERQDGSIVGDVAAALGLGTGEEVATIAKIYRDTAGLQYSIHRVGDRPDVMILIRSTSDISDSWKIVRTGSIERSVHVDEQDKIHVAKFHPRLFEETLNFFEARVREVRVAAPAANNQSTAALAPAAAPSAAPAAPWLQPADASIAPANNVAALIERGTKYNLNSDYDRAIADFNQAIRLDANSAAAFYGRAAVYYNMGDFDRAIQDYDQVLRIDPRYNMAIAFRALAYDRKNQR